MTPEGTGLDALARSLVVFGNEATIAQRLSELLAQGLDELVVLLVPVQDASQERAQLVRLIGSMQEHRLFLRISDTFRSISAIALLFF